MTDSVVRLHAFAALSREGMEVPITRAEIFWNPASDVRAEEAARERDARIALLVSLELFRPLTDHERKALSAELKPAPFVTGDVVTREGEPAESLYILARGQVGIFRDAAQPAESPRQRLATLSAPGYFGEMGLLTGQARTATVVAEGEVLCYRLDKPGFEAILKARPEMAEGAVADAGCPAGGQRCDARLAFRRGARPRDRLARFRPGAEDPAVLRYLGRYRRSGARRRARRASASARCRRCRRSPAR